MKLFNKKREYQAKEECFNRVEEIQSEELKYERYSLAYTFLTNNYWNRKNKELEDELFKMIETYNMEDGFIINKSSEYKKKIKLKRYEILKQFLFSLSEDEINSNIFLKSAYSFINMSEEVCLNIITELSSKLSIVNESTILTLEFKIPEETKKLIPDYICEYTSIKNYKKEDYKIGHIDILDSNHKYVYDDYNLVCEKLGKLAEDIYYLKLNEILSNIPSLYCYHFQVYHPGYNDCFIASFAVKDNQTEHILKKKML